MEDKNMFSLRGDAHKIYLQLKKTSNKGRSFNSIKKLTEIDEIQNFYKSIDSRTLEKIYYRMIKEKNGSGTIPIFVSSVPWLFFLFSRQLQQFLFKEGSLLWVVFVFVYISILTIGVILHFHEKSWAAVHIEIIQDILKERKNKSS
ncbi:hypothetical protein ACFOU2_20315 [Bacillus songklensis]|uniref:Uncharacterized protein n=1 Tax=Bacillus songklensis TaxID=1069116 RepID=A0ABV8B917_9BACI